MIASGQLIGVANTGPMISAFQSARVDVLQALFHLLYVPAATLPEYQKHGVRDLVDGLIQTGFVRVETLTAIEKIEAQRVAVRIAASPLAKDKEPANHLPDAEAMVLAQRSELAVDIVLLDERAARQVAAEMGLRFTGFAGVLGQGYELRVLTREEVREALLLCQSLGTFYSDRFIDEFLDTL